jgi:hypothetical protein
MDGKVAPGPCGHPHKFIFNQFSLCTWVGCDGSPPKRVCPKCSSRDVSPFAAPPLVQPGSYACSPCGAVFRPGI